MYFESKHCLTPINSKLVSLTKNSKPRNEHNKNLMKFWLHSAVLKRILKDELQICDLC